MSDSFCIIVNVSPFNNPEATLRAFLRCILLGYLPVTENGENVKCKLVGYIVKFGIAIYAIYYKYLG